MSSSALPNSERVNPAWFWDYLGIAHPRDAEPFEVGGQTFTIHAGIPRSCALRSPAQGQTEQVFGYKWKKRSTFESPASLVRMREWLIERYGEISTATWLHEHGERPILLDAGCGAGMSGLELFEPVLSKMRYLGVDVSEAVDVARQRFRERGFTQAFMQADICNLPLPDRSIDLIFSEGVLHHTNSTERALKALARLLKLGGRFLFYVYRRKGPIREFTDDLMRERLKALSPDEAWKAMEPLTHLGIALGELNAEITIPESIDLLKIPAGRINVQRLFYWHVAKLFYRPDLSFDEMNHINFDWYAPVNAHRQSPEEVRQWCRDSSLTIEREIVEDAGITIIARKHD